MAAKKAALHGHFIHVSRFTFILPFAVYVL